MNRSVVILAGLALGLTSPIAAHAQFLDDVVRKAISAGESAPRPESPSPVFFPRFAELPQQGKGRGNDDREQRERDQPQPERGPPIRLVPLSQIQAQIQRSTPGRLLDASGPSGGDRPVYTIRWQANSGQRIDFVVDAQSGSILSRRGG